MEKLKERNLYENTIIIYTSDHGCHFKTKAKDCVPNGYDDYKRSCFENTIHIPMIISGPNFKGGKTVERLVSLMDIPKTIITAAGGDVSDMRGDALQDVFFADKWKDEIYIQISESYVGRAVRTSRYTYCVYDPNKNPIQESKSDVYVERYLFDNELDPEQENNLIHDPKYATIKTELRQRLISLAKDAGEGDVFIKRTINGR